MIDGKKESSLKSDSLVQLYNFAKVKFHFNREFSFLFICPLSLGKDPIFFSFLFSLENEI